MIELIIIKILLFIYINIDHLNNSAYDITKDIFKKQRSNLNRDWPYFFAIGHNGFLLCQ